MCKQTDSIEARRQAAKGLREACTRTCAEDVGGALHSIYDGTAKEAPPSDMGEILGKIDQADSATRVTKH